MAQIGDDAGISTVVAMASKRLNVLSFGCRVYLLFSIACSFWYIFILSPSMTNDLFWLHWNATATQTFVIDMFNNQLSTTSGQEVVISSLEHASLKDYSLMNTMTDVNIGYGRMIQYSGNLTQLFNAIQGIRSTPANRVLWMMTQYCWVDFDFRWEIAHTASRQLRCQQERYRVNGAMFLESVLRNVIYSEILGLYGGPGNVLTLGILNTLSDPLVAPSGPGFLAYIAGVNKNNTVAQEVEYWRARNISHYTLQWHNRRQVGLSETISITNALGLTSTISIKNIPFVERRTVHTTGKTYWMFVNDIWFAQVSNSSLIRGSPNHFSTKSVTMMQSAGFSPPYNLPTTVFLSHIGEYVTIDTDYTPVPQSLINLFKTLRKLIFECLQSNSTLAQNFFGISDVEIHPMPSAWQGYIYYGGSTLCPFMAKPKTFISRSFGFDDACSVPIIHKDVVNRFTVLFALVGLDLPSTLLPSAIVDTCTQSTIPGEAALCIIAMSSISSIYSTLRTTYADVLIPLAAVAKLDVKKLNIRQIQFAKSNNGSQLLLEQELVANDTDPWSLLGWMQLYDWVTGTREVVSFEGDIRSIRLISYQYTHLNVPAMDLEIGYNTSAFLFYLSTHTTSMLLFMAIVVVAYSLWAKSKHGAINFLSFNRVTGPTWVGRSFLIIRGATALILLATAPVTLEKAGGLTNFLINKRPWYYSMILAGEFTWVIYVLNDVLNIFINQDTAALASRLGCTIAWLGVWIWDVASPITITATISRVCQGTNMDWALNCESGSIYIGSFTRTTWMLLYVVLVALMAYPVASIFTIKSKKRSEQPNMFLTGAATVFFEQPNDSGGFYANNASCAMFGLLRGGKAGNMLFDVNRWFLVRSNDLDFAMENNIKSALTFPSATFTEDRRRRSSYSIITLAKLNEVFDASKLSEKKFTLNYFQVPAVIAGMIYMCATIFASATYLAVSQGNLANDYWWSDFNATGGLTYLGNWYTIQLQLRPIESTILQLDSPVYADLQVYNGTVSTGVASSTTYADYRQYEDLSDLSKAIAGLRVMDACNVPYLATQYCFVDFKRRWSLANSAGRAKRCLVDNSGNAALFLESILRNVDWKRWSSCWQTEFNYAIGNLLSSSNEGAAWLTSMINANLDLNDEIALWKSYNISVFLLQFQNYKMRGATEMYDIQNAFGVSYPITLKSIPPVMALATQTSMSMYWTLFGDFYAISNSSKSIISGLSLIRESPNYAFMNITMESLLVYNGTLSSPYDFGSNFTRSTVGPFGSIDCIYVTIPSSVLNFWKNLTSTINSILWVNLTAQDTFKKINVPANLYSTPRGWLDPTLQYAGGNVHCSAQGAQDITLLRFASFGLQKPCTSNLREVLYPTPMQVVVSLVSMGFIPDTTNSSSRASRICAAEFTGGPPCAKAILQALSFISGFFTLPSLQIWQNLAMDVANDVRSLQIEQRQFAVANHSQYLLLRAPLMDSDIHGDYNFYGWLFLQEWLLGLREVVNYIGDNGKYVSMSAYLPGVVSIPNPLEIPYSLNMYINAWLQYITGIICLVAILAVINCIVSRGNVEGINIFNLNRMAGTVWVGRPLLVLRGVAAICLLSTSSLKLVQNGKASMFETKTIPWYQAILASGEVGWIIYVYNDMMTIFTSQYTYHTALTSSLLMWLIAALFAFLSPVSHTASVSRDCVAVELDFNIYCQSGTVAIGNVHRFCLMLIIAAMCTILCFIIFRISFRHLQVPIPRSLLLSSTARYVYELNGWVHDDIYHLDRMSAVLNGLIVFSRNSIFYALDIKTWRFLIIPMSTTCPKKLQGSLPLTQ